jgi:putative GTP pyrophosphokinase
MAEKLTISQLNKLGERLRRDPDNKDDLRLLETFRLSFTQSYDRVFGQLRELGLDPAGRPAKSTQSIIAKLVRLRTRLSRMQDIAGCRVEVENIPQQDRVVGQIAKFYPEAQIDDLRVEPSHGYRAVHVIVKVAGFPVEIQVRTALQNSWAQATESLADGFDPEIKYGGGPDFIRNILERVSTTIATDEKNEADLIELRATVKGGILLDRVRSAETQSMKLKQQLLDVLERIMMAIEKKV